MTARTSSVVVAARDLIALLWRLWPRQEPAHRQLPIGLNENDNQFGEAGQIGQLRPSGKPNTDDRDGRGRQAASRASTSRRPATSRAVTGRAAGSSLIVAAMTSLIPAGSRPAMTGGRDRTRRIATTVSSCGSVP